MHAMTRPDGTAAVEVIAPDRQGGWTALGLGVYLIACGAAVLYFMIYIWAGQLQILEAVLPGIDFTDDHLKDVQTFVYMTCGAAIGGVLLCLRGLHKYAVILRTFDCRFTGSYLLGPWAAGLIGIATFAMLRGGLLVFGAEGGEAGAGSSFAFLSIGIMTGFAWERMLARIDDAARQVFGSRRPATSTAS